MYLKSLEVEEYSSQRNPKRIESKLDKLIALYVCENRQLAKC